MLKITLRYCLCVWALFTEEWINYQFSREIRVSILLFFLSLDRHLWNITFSVCLHSLVKTEANIWENSRANQWKPETHRSREFSPAREFSQTLPRFSPDYEGTENMFYFFYKIIFHFNKEKDDMLNAYV